MLGNCCRWDACSSGASAWISTGTSGVTPTGRSFLERSDIMTPHTAIVLFNLGGPDDLASVEPFLVNLFQDRDIIQLPGGPALQPWMARLVAKMRGPSVRNNYRRIGGGSPQLRITREQACALER